LNTTKRIKETKDNSVYLECDLIGDGTEENPYMPEVFKTNPNAYFHLDMKDIDYTTRKVKIYVSKINTNVSDIQNIKENTKFITIKETNLGKEEVNKN
jgi:hypothetical protein